MQRELDGWSAILIVPSHASIEIGLMGLFVPATVELPLACDRTND